MLKNYCDDKVVVYYGGSFSPPTIAHLKMAEYIIDVLLQRYHSVDFYYFLSSETHGYKKEHDRGYNKGDNFAETKYREMMLQESIKYIKPKLGKNNNYRIFIDNYEVIIGYSGKTLNDDKEGFVEYLKNKNSKHIYLLFGIDNGKKFLSSNIDLVRILMDNFFIIIVSRENEGIKNIIKAIKTEMSDYVKNNLFKIYIYEIGNDYENISSSHVRNLLKSHNQEYKKYIVPNVVSIIYKYNLFNINNN